MYFTAQQYRTYKNSNQDYGIYNRNTGLYEFRKITLKEARDSLRAVKADLIARRLGDMGGGPLSKWYRPWDVVPAISNYKAPSGDFGIGIEVEHGFQTPEAMRAMATKVLSWRNVALDNEGGPNGIEVTFPPMDYSKFKNSRALKYVRLLAKPSTEAFVHKTTSMIGTHVNVSSGLGDRNFSPARIQAMSRILSSFRYDMDVLSQDTRAKCIKYFGRVPYSGAFAQGTKFVEFKLFDSNRSAKSLKRYVNIAVELYKLSLEGNFTPIAQGTVFAACEIGYNK